MSGKEISGGANGGTRILLLFLSFFFSSIILIDFVWFVLVLSYD